MRVNGKRRNPNLVLGTLNGEGHMQDEINMLEWIDVVILDDIALTETKMVKHEEIYPSIST